MTFNWSGKEPHFTFLFFRVSPVNQWDTVIVGHSSSVFSPSLVVKYLHFCHLLPSEISLDARETSWWLSQAWRGILFNLLQLMKALSNAPHILLFSPLLFILMWIFFPLFFNISRYKAAAPKYENIWWYIYPEVKIILTQFCGLSLIQILIYFQKNCTSSVAETVSRHDTERSKSSTIRTGDRKRHKQGKIVIFYFLTWNLCYVSPNSD